MTRFEAIFLLCTCTCKNGEVTKTREIPHKMLTYDKFTKRKYATNEFNVKFQ